MTKAEQCQVLLLDNERDQASVERRYKTAACRMQAGMELRLEREALLDELERLTGRREFRIDEIAAALPASRPPEDGDGPKDKEPVHA